MNKNVVDLQEIVKESVASPPEVYLKVKETIDCPNFSFKDLSKIINNDPALVARILQIVNSSLYGFEDKIENVDHALNVMGVEPLNELILATSVMKNFKDFPKEIWKNLVDMKSFWRHSIACGVTGKYLAQKFGFMNTEKFYLLGMLHDMGSLVLYTQLPEVSKEILIRCKNNKENLSDVEIELLGMSHARVGAHLMKEWGLPQRIYEPVAFHHQPLQSGVYTKETVILHLADCIADELALGNSGEFGPSPIHPGIMKRFKLKKSPAKAIESEIRDKFYTALSIFT
jgi:HD-like signal output (HDOD) protein